MSQTRTETPPTRPPLDDTEVVDPAEGFGQLWHKHYEVSLEGTGHSPEEIIRIWRDRYGEFWPEGNHFQRPLAGLRPNEMAVSELEMPAGTKLTTGVIVDEVNPTSFSFKTPKGHTFAGSIRFYAKSVNAEPVAGLDMVAREDFYRLLLEDYAATGRTFVISTHILEEAATVFERVLILKEGRLIENCETDDLLAQFCEVSGRDDVVDAACTGYEVLHTEALGRQKSCTVRAPMETIAARGLDVDCTALTLQKVFVALCGHEREGI